MGIHKIFLRFSNFCFDPEGHLLCYKGTAVSITPKLFNILATLLSYKGQVVTKQTLMNAAWPDTFVEENNLNWNVHILRRKLDERPDRRFIVTVPKIGFRFAVPIEESD